MDNYSMEVPTNKISDIFRYYVGLMEDQFGIAESKSFMYILFKHYLSIKRMDIAKDPSIRLSESELLKIHFAVKDLKSYKPIQHIIGSTEFCGFNFIVSPDVLIPRPETEEIIEIIVKESKNLKTPISILDIGTGSGCIAISLNLKISNSIVYAVDISNKALVIAKENAKINKASVKFSQIDVLSNEDTARLQKFDIIVSNPPYVRISEKRLMQKNVLNFEPKDALFVTDEDPLLFYRTIAKLGQTHLKTNGKLFFEINEAFGADTVELLKNHKYSNIEIFKDFRSKDRFISAVLID